MNELQVMNLEHTDISLWDFDRLHQELQQSLDSYAGLVYTDESIKDAKTDRSTLNKVKKTIEDARKAYKAKCLAPYEAIEPKIKELVDMVEAQRGLIDSTVKEYEARQKEAKEKEVREYYDRVSGSLGSDAGKIYEKVFDPKWTNATTGAAKYREAIQIAVAESARDLERIKALNSPFADTLRELYLETLSMEEVLKKNDELQEAAGRAGLTGSPQGIPETGTVPTPASSEGLTVDEEKGTLLRIHASQARLNQICDFLHAIGVTYEIV